MKAWTSRMTGLVAAMVLLVAGVAGATDYTWTGAGDGKWWTNASNWGGSGYPNGAGDTALINTGSTAITNTGDLTLGALTLDGTFRGTNNLGGNLTITTSGGGSGNLTVNAGTLKTARDKASGITVAGTFAIGAGGTTIVQRAHATLGTHGAGQTLTAGALTVAGNLNADGQGFDSGKGPGTGGIGDGGSHGGRGGDYTPYWNVGPTYGLFTNPTSLGSGSDSAYSPGGGAIVVVVSGAVTVNGLLSANGGNSARGGSGGSINITAASLAGAGTIRANGGDASSNGGGGGGRIAFSISGTDSFSGLVAANSGAGAVNPGSAGTIYFSQQKRDNLTLGGAGNMRTLRLGTDDTMGPGRATNYVFGAVTIETNGTMEMDGNVTLNVVGGITNGTVAVLTMSTLEVKGGGLISANYRGFPPALGGPGKCVFADGGSHGGRGGDYVVSTYLENDMGPTYGSVTNPIALGSGSESLVRGGGAVIIAASGTVTLNGIISANGEGVAGNRAGSGGSINITASDLVGSGTNQANGGSGGNGAGGGGRVAVVLTSGTDFGSVVFQAFGGTSGTRGAAGTVYLQHAGHAAGKGIVIVDNNNSEGYIGSFTELSTGGNVVHDFARVIITNKGNLAIRTNDALDFSLLTLSGTGTNSAFLTISGTNGIVFPASFTLFTNCALCLDVPVAVAGNWTIPGGALLSHNNNFSNDVRKLTLSLLGNLTVQTNGAINVDGSGYANGKGPGSSSGNGNGGSYGGRGADYTAGTAGPTYGSVINPTVLGSGGQANNGSAGGGAILLTVSGVLTNNGLISASGKVVDRGGSGGSIKITASSLAGTGVIRANGGTGSVSGGGGGRVALFLNSGSSVGAVAVDALGGTTASRQGAAGTVYLELAGQASGRGVVRIDNAATAPASTNVVTEIPAKTNAMAFIGELAGATLVVTNKAILALTTNVTVGDLYLKSTASTNLYLKGWTLTVKSFFHPDWGSTNGVNYAGGQILWKMRQGTLIVVR